MVCRSPTRGQAEKEFRAEVEAIGHVRHKNLVRLLGYCIEGTHRYILLSKYNYAICHSNQWMSYFHFEHITF